MAERRLDDALEELERGLIFNAHNQKALALKAAVLRLMGRKEEAINVCRQALTTDAFNYGCRHELFLLTGDESHRAKMVEMMHGMANNYDEVALDYQAAGLADEARAIWQTAISQHAATPMTYYHLGMYAEARQADSAYCFPNRPEEAIVLERAKKESPDDPRAPYYLGCLYYDKRQYDLAILNWELSARLDPSFPTVWRNLALARFNKQNQPEEALQYMERAFRLDPTDSRILMELDQLYKRLQKPHEERLAFLHQYHELIARRDDLVLEEITLLNQTGRYEEAMAKLDAHQFHPWEGGEGKVPAQYQTCRLELAKRALAHGQHQQAIDLLMQCLDYPHHLGEGKLHGAQDNDFHYFLGCACEAMGRHEEAVEWWEKATEGPQEPAAAMYYNDAKPDKIFYQGLALLKLGRKDEANGRFYRLINYGKQHIFEPQVMDYFAVSLPDLLIWDDSLDRKNAIHCRYLLALGYLGLGDMTHAKRYMEETTRLDINHQGAQALKDMLG